MQRKVFFIDGRPVLATRGDGLFETAGTLQRLIDQGEQVLHYQRQAAPPVVAPPVVAPPVLAPVASVPEPVPEAAPAPEPEPVALAPPEAEAPPIAPRPARRPRRRAVPSVEAEAEPPAMAALAVTPLPEAESADLTQADPTPGDPTPGDPTLGNLALGEPTPGDLAPGDLTLGGAGRSREARSPRWQTAGAERRGRAARHWTQRTR